MACCGCKEKLEMLELKVDALIGIVSDDGK